MALNAKLRNLVVVGASAGGQQALSALIARLPASLPAAVLIVQHIAPYQPSMLAKVLSRSTSMRVKQAQDEDQLDVGTIYVAVADRHLMVEHDRIRLARGPRECRARPSVNVLFRSAAVTFGRRAVGVVLSGALDDGTAGLWAIKDSGGMALVQDPREALHSSMPENAISHVEVDLVGPVSALCDKIVDSVGSVVTNGGAPDAKKGLRVENEIATGESGLHAGVMELGEPSKYTCPECHGVLLRIQEGPIVRFRCHTGHAHSAKSLELGLIQSFEDSISDTLRALEERIMLLVEMGATVKATNRGDAEKWQDLVERLQERLALLREMLTDPSLPGSGGEERSAQSN